MAERGKGTHLIIFTHADAGAKGTDFNRKEGKDSGESFMKSGREGNRFQQEGREG